MKDYNSSGVLQKETNYAYDTHNRLIKSTYDADGAGAGAATARYWAFDEGINPLLEFKSGSASDVSHRYLWGASVDQLFADEQPTSTGSAGNVLWALADNLGTIRDIADLSGSTTSVTNHRRFGAYGNLVSESNSAVDLAFAFTGKLYDENTKLQNNLFRWYDAAIGQWTSQDPLGFVAGDENLRRYVSGDATGTRDASGLVSVIGGFFQRLGQGAANLVNGVQDVGVGILNTPAAIANTTADGIDYLTGNSDPHNQIRIPYIPSPDWSRDLITHEAGMPGTWSDTHGWSKFLAGEGAASLLTGGFHKVANVIDDGGKCANIVARNMKQGCFVAGTPVAVSRTSATPLNRT